MLLDKSLQKAMWQSIFVYGLCARSVDARFRGQDGKG